MLNTLKDNIKKIHLFKGKPFAQSCVILIVSVLVVWYVAVTMLPQSINYTKEQLPYTSKTSKVGYIDNGTSGVFSYGPYMNLEKGSYRITIYYETDSETTYDMCYQDGNKSIQKLQKGTLESNRNHKAVVIYNTEKIDNNSFEIRTFYPGSGYLQINGISVERWFYFDKYILITFLTIIISLLLLCGKKLAGFLQRPREVLSFACFYTTVLCSCLYSMSYLADHDKMWLHSVLNFLIVMHSYGSRKGLYDNDNIAKNLVNMICSVFQFYTLYRLDKVMRGIVSKGTKPVYSDDTPYIFTYSIIACIMLIVLLIRRLWVKRVFYGIVYYVFVLLLAVQCLYYQVFERLFSFKDIQLASEGLDYTGYVLSLIDADFCITFSVTIVFGVAGIYLFKYTRRLSLEWKIAACSVVIVVVLYVNTVYAKGYVRDNYRASDTFIYETMTDRTKAFKLCGFYQYELRDLRKTVFKDQVGYKEQSEEVETFFETKDADLVQTNLMTGILKGKNIIFVLMESVDDIACTKEVMPTLYQMSKEGICFSNMYASIYGTAATLNSEMVTNVGCYAPQDGSVIISFADNYFPHSLATRFTKAGYTARQYHFNDPAFYNRGLMNKTFGYREYVRYSDHMKSKDVSSMDTIIVEDDELYQTLVEDEKFFDYIISYTAHVPYDETDENTLTALQRHPEYEGMTDSEELNNYFAKARITDDMLSGLIQRLEHDGLLENTVIVAMGDHYPYGLSDKDALYDFSGVDRYEQLLYKVPFVVWSPGLEAVEVNKLASSIDILPTIVNLMGLGDCSMYIGNDIFNENYEGYAYFSDGSWLCGDSYYYQGKLVYGTMDEAGIEAINKKVMEAITVNDCILHTDYWRSHN